MSLEVPELVPEDPLVRLKCPGKQAGWLDLLPNISALSSIALDVSFSEVLGAIPGMTVYLAHYTVHIKMLQHLLFLTHLSHTYSRLERGHGIVWDLGTPEIANRQDSSNVKITIRKRANTLDVMSSQRTIAKLNTSALLS